MNWQNELLVLLTERNNESFSVETDVNEAITNISAPYVMIEEHLLANKYDSEALEPKMNRFVHRIIMSGISGVVLGYSPFDVCLPTEVLLLEKVWFTITSYCSGTQVLLFDDILNIVRKVRQLPVSKGLPLIFRTNFGQLQIIPSHTGVMDDGTDVYVINRDKEMTLIFSTDKENMLAVTGEPCDEDFDMLKSMVSSCVCTRYIQNHNKEL